jgi:mono/diheme cytochrome c family protein
MSPKKIVTGIGLCLVFACAAWAQGDAKDIYLDKCSVCHGADGAAKTAKGRKLKMSDVHQTVPKQSEAEMIGIVTNGKGSDMDGFGKDLMPDQIKAIVQYYRGLAK